MLLERISICFDVAIAMFAVTPATAAITRWRRCS